MRRRLTMLLAVLSVPAGLWAFTDGPLTPIGNLRGRTDENGYLRVSKGTSGVTDGPLTPIGNLRGRTDENGYLRVSCDDCGTPGGSDTQVQFNDGGSFGGDAGLVYNKTTDTLTVGTEIKTSNYSSSTGAASFSFPAVNSARVGTGSAPRWNWTSAGHYTAADDNTYDIGAVGATRPRSIYIGGLIQWGNAAEPACNATNRGAVVLVQGGVGVADTFRVCTKDNLDVYAYRALF